MDRREEILNIEYRKWVDEKGIGAIYPPNFPEAYKEAGINAMDENAKQMCLELLEYMANHDVECNRHVKDGPMFLYKGEWMTKDRLFENFL